MLIATVMVPTAIVVVATHNLAIGVGIGVLGATALLPAASPTSSPSNGPSKPLMATPVDSAGSSPQRAALPDALAGFILG